MTGDNVLRDAIDLSGFPLHCPKCGMEFHRQRWPHLHAKTSASPCSDCGTKIVSPEPDFGRPARLMVVSVDQARRCWGLA